MANQTKGKLEKSTDVKESLPPNPPTIETPVESLMPSREQPKQYVNFVFLGLLLAALLVTAFAVRKSTQQKYKAAVDPTIAHVLLDPGVIITKSDAEPIQVSTLAYDENYNPVWSGVGYNWGISTAGSVGTLSLNPGNDKIAVFKALNKGVGDIFVTAVNKNGKAFGSIQVFVDVTPTPTPTPSPSPTPTETPIPTPTPLPTPEPTPIPTPEPGSIINGSFETGTDVPNNWRRTNKSSPRDFRTDALSYDGDFSFKFFGKIDKVKGLSQTINNTWKSGTKLFIGGWLKTLKLNKRGTSQITVIADYSDKTREKFTLAFPTGRSFDWTYRLGSFNLSKTTTSIQIKLVYSNQNGEGYFDAITLSSTQPLRAQATPLKAEKASSLDTQD